MGKEIFKWGAIAIVLLVVWHWVSNFGGARASLVGTVDPGVPQWGQNVYYQGVYGPVMIPTTNPFYSSPMGGGKRGRR